MMMRNMSVRVCLAMGVIVLGLSAAGGVRADQVSAVAAAKAQDGVLDAMVDTGGNMYVSVKAEKNKWGKFAENICTVVVPHRARIFKVRVVDITTVALNQPKTKWKILGEASCG